MDIQDVGGLFLGETLLKMKVVWQELVWVEPQIGPVLVFLVKIFFFCCKAFLLTSYRGKWCICVKIKYYRATCPSAMPFYLFLCPRNPSVAIVVDVKAYIAVRCCQWAELLLREVPGQDWGSCWSTRIPTASGLSGHFVAVVAASSQSNAHPGYKGLVRNHLQKFHFLSLKNCLIGCFRKKIG